MGIFGPKMSVSLELRDENLKAVELAKTGRNIYINNYGEKKLPEGIISSGKLHDSTGLAKALSELWSETNFKSNDVVIGLSNQDVIVRFTSFPKTEEKKLDNMVRFQAQDIFPLDISSFIFDYAVIGEKSEKGQSFWEVLLVAGKEQMIYDFVHCLDEAGLKTQEIEVLFISMMRLLSEEQMQQVLTLVDMGGGINNLLIINCGVPRLARMTSPAGVEDEEMVATGEIAFSETAPSGEDEMDQENQESYVDSQLGYIINNIGMSIDYYHSQNPESPVEKIVVCGIDVSEQNTIISQLEEGLGLPVEVNDPMNALNIIDNGVIGEKASKFSQSISLAFKGLEAI